MTLDSKVTEKDESQSENDSLTNHNEVIQSELKLRDTVLIQKILDFYEFDEEFTADKVDDAIQASIMSLVENSNSQLYPTKETIVVLLGLQKLMRTVNTALFPYSVK